MAIGAGNQKVRYDLDKDYRFVIENYNWAKPFSNFFPGIGGKWGVPMWVFYVNRAQCVSSLGLRDKDNAIIEFHSFNKALQLIDRYGFRTFIKTPEGLLYEPFQKNRDEKIRQTMAVSSGELEINELNPELGIQTNVLYFPLIVSRVTCTVEDAREFITWLRDLVNDEELYNQLLDLVSHQFSPGEAKDAGVGIACGKGKGVVFRKGKKVGTVAEKDFTTALMREVEGVTS